MQRQESHDASNQVGQPEAAMTSEPSASAKTEPSSSLEVHLDFSQAELARARAAQQLMRQAEREAQRYLEKALSLSDNLRLSRAKQRSAWGSNLEAEEETED